MSALVGLSGCSSSFVAVSSAHAATTQSFADRLSADTLTMPPLPVNLVSSTGVDNLFYPAWLAGEWQVTQTLVEATTPLGLKYIGGPNASIEIATESFQEQRRQINVPVTFRLRYVPSRFGVVEDRVFNTQQRLDGFAGRRVVSSVDYNDVAASNRAAVLKAGGTDTDPLQTTVVRYKGPAAQKTFVLSHGTGSSDLQTNNDWTGYELQRSIFALTNQNTAPPITTDTELIWRLEKTSPVMITGKLRIASYLNAQSDSLYFEAKNRAVSFADYTLQMKRI